MPSPERSDARLEVRLSLSYPAHAVGVANGRARADLANAARAQADAHAFRLAVDLQLPARGVTALFGRSGSGKTTLLRAIAGLERAPDGRVQLADECWQDEAHGYFLPTWRRPLGYVFQEASLFAHLSVLGNIEYGARRVRGRHGAVQREAVIELLGIGHLLQRRPERLSGGERQRVAIARALLAAPRLLLMDEPLAALDAARKAEILPYLERLHDELEIPVLYVSHALDEVTRLADHLVVLEAGQVMACGGLAATLSRLDLPALAVDDGGAVIEAEVLAHDEAYHLSRIGFAGGSLWVGRTMRQVGERVRAQVAARDVSLALTAPMQSSILNVLPAVVCEIRDDGPDTVGVRVDLGGAGTYLLARITRRSRDALALAPGCPVYAQVKGVALL